MSTLTLRPNADSTPLDLVCSTGTTHYALVDESSPDDADYVYRTDTAGSYYYDYYGLPNHTTETGTITGIQVYARCSGTSGYTPPDGYGQIKCKISGTAYSLGSAFNIYTDSWVNYDSGSISVNPATSAAWTWSDIDALIIGIGLETGVYGGTSKCSQLYVVVTYVLPPTIDSFTANPEHIDLGESSTLSWETTGATSCSINKGIGAVAVDGSTSVSPSSTTTYTLSATNAGGTVTANATVTLDTPTIDTFTADPENMVYGAGSLLEWTTTGASSCSINQGIGSVTVDGSRSVNPTATTTYTLSATNSSGTTTDDVTVTLLAPTVDTFSASPENIKFGNKSLLTWATTGAASVSIDQGVGTVAVDGDKNVQPDDTTKYTLTATNSSGNDTGDVTVTVIPADKVKIRTSESRQVSPDYGRLAQMNSGKPYLQFSSDLTEHYIESIGYDCPSGDFKRPYLAEDYNSMMYLHGDTSAERSPNLKDVASGKITGVTPDKDDMYFDFSQQLASVSNFNSYAAENYRLMGKTIPEASLRFSGVIESIGCNTETTIYAGINPILTVVSPQYDGDRYSWSGKVTNGSGDWGRLSNNNGLSVTYITPGLTANYRLVTISLLLAGQVLDEIEFTVWYQG